MKSMIKTPILATLMTCSLVAEANFVDRVINRLDASKDGQISQEEFNMVDRKMILGLDANEDGVVTIEEVENHDNERKAEMNERMKAKREQAILRFQSADIDGDGMVTAEEARTERFNFIDENDDEQLSAEEFRNAMSNRVGGKIRSGKFKRPRHERFGKLKQFQGDS